MTDIEALILIARAVGVSLDTQESDNPRKVTYFREFYPNYESWNPSRFNDDALYVAIELNLSIAFYTNGEFPDHVIVSSKGAMEKFVFIEEFGDDKFAATRKAIVAVATEVSLRAYI